MVDIVSLVHNTSYQYQSNSDNQNVAVTPLPPPSLKLTPNPRHNIRGGLSNIDLSPLSLPIRQLVERVIGGVLQNVRSSI